MRCDPLTMSAVKGNVRLRSVRGFMFGADADLARAFGVVHT